MNNRVLSLGLALVAGTLLAAACGGDEEKFEVTGLVIAGPTCPAQQGPPDPACADKPVGSASIDVVNNAGKVVGTVVTTTSGEFAILLEEGSYNLRPRPVDGMTGTAEPLGILVTRGGIVPSERTLVYDTGVR